MEYIKNQMGRNIQGNGKIMEKIDMEYNIIN